MQLLQYISRFVQSWKRDSTVIPAVCFASCNECYTEAQKVGKSPALCAANSTFMTQYQACQTCVVANSDISKSSNASSYVSPQLAPFLDFCAAQSPQVISTAIVNSITSQITSFSSLRNFTETTTATVYLTPNSLGTTPAIQQITGTNTPAPSNSVKASKNNGWIAGVVIGPVIALVLLVASIFFIHRRRRQKAHQVQGVGGLEEKVDKEEEKVQLHGESRIIHELSTEGYRDSMPELPAREPVGLELSGGERK